MEACLEIAWHVLQASNSHLRRANRSAPPRDEMRKLLPALNHSKHARHEAQGCA